jgi:hypothetical protein
MRQRLCPQALQNIVTQVVDVFVDFPVLRLVGHSVVLLSLLSSAQIAGAQPGPPTFVDAAGNSHPGFSFRFINQTQLAKAIQAQERINSRILSKRGVVGSAIGWDDDGNPVIRVFSAGAARNEIPESVGGFAIRIEESGPIFAIKYACRQADPDAAVPCPDEVLPAEASSTRTIDRHRPVPNGVSVAHQSASAGTVGCIVTQGCHFYMLSNNHVLALENNANVGDLILQPGPYDWGVYPDDAVATAFAWVDIEMSPSANNRVDAAIALIEAQDFTNTTMADGYGMPNADWRVPEAGMNVMKFGRATRHTEGVITGINATAYVNYGSCCARFIDQVIVEPTASYGDFARVGDSGSLIVQRGGSDERAPVALVFALAENGAAFANPIDVVVSELDIEILGN